MNRIEQTKRSLAGDTGNGGVGSVRRVRMRRGVSFVGARALALARLVTAIVPLPSNLRRRTDRGELKQRT